MAYQVAVCGPAEATAEDEAHAFRVGQLLAEHDATVICGGGAGVMAAVAAGARSRDGLVVGVLPSGTRGGAAPDLSVTLVTNMGSACNAIIVWSADAVIAIGGSWGTLSEIAFARRRGDIPVVCIGGWWILDPNGNPVPGMEHVETATVAVRLALRHRPGGANVDTVPP